MGLNSFGLTNICYNSMIYMKIKEKFTFILFFLSYFLLIKIKRLIDFLVWLSILVLIILTKIIILIFLK